MRRRAFLASLAAASASVPAFARAQVAAPGFALGDDVFLAGEWQRLSGLGIGVITNQTGVTSARQTLVDALRNNPAVRLHAIYAPEHGFRGDRPAGEYVASYTDAQTKLPVYSLYGPTRHPNAEMLRNVDALLFDIQDVGSRAYTFISTMAYAMQTAKQFDKQFWVLDRPNPVGGDLVEGPVLEPAFSSFIGLYPIAMRHGMTVGELARMFNDHFGIGCDLHVVPMHGYTRETIWPDTRLQWIRSSPNIPTWQTTFPYLCTGLIDNAGVNNGVGTDRPFFYAGGYGLDGDALAKALASLPHPVPGVTFRAASWVPERGFWAGKTLSGVELVLDDPRVFLSTSAAVNILCAIRSFAPRFLSIKDPAALDRDWGTDSLRLGLTRGASAGEIVDGWSANVNRFRALRANYLLY